MTTAYSEIIDRIAKDHNIKVIQAACVNQSWACNDEIWLGIYEEPEFHLLSFFHEMGHHLDKSAWHLDDKATKYDIEKAAWYLGYILAHKYAVKFSNEAIEWGQKQLRTYEKYK